MGTVETNFRDRSSKVSLREGGKGVRKEGRIKAEFYSFIFLNWK